MFVNLSVSGRCMEHGACKTRTFTFINQRVIKLKLRILQKRFFTKSSTQEVSLLPPSGMWMTYKRFVLNRFLFRLHYTVSISHSIILSLWKQCITNFQYTNRIIVGCKCSILFICDLLMLTISVRCRLYTSRAMRDLCSCFCSFVYR